MSEKFKEESKIENVERQGIIEEVESEKSYNNDVFKERFMNSEMAFLLSHLNEGRAMGSRYFSEESKNRYTVLLYAIEGSSGTSILGVRENKEGEPDFSGIVYYFGKVKEYPSDLPNTYVTPSNANEKLPIPGGVKVLDSALVENNIKTGNKIELDVSFLSGKSEIQKLE